MSVNRKVSVRPPTCVTTGDYSIEITKPAPLNTTRGRDKSELAETRGSRTRTIVDVIVRAPTVVSQQSAVQSAADLAARGLDTRATSARSSRFDRSRHREHPRFRTLKPCFHSPQVARYRPLCA
jgi:hypothetical protein